MAKTTFVLVLLSILCVTTSTSKSAATSSSSASEFIKSSCTATLYPALCVQSLSAYAEAIQESPRQLAQTALSVSLSKAQSTKTFVTKLSKFKGMKGREIEAIKDCLDEMGDSIDRLSKSIQELKKVSEVKGQDFEWHMSNVETWVSAALTDDNTCVDGFAGKALNGKIKASIRAQVANVAQVTSNALAFINRYASRH